MNWNTRLFLKINSFVGHNVWLDAFGRAGAEWALVALVGGFAASVIIASMGSARIALWQLIFLVVGIGIGWLLNIAIGIAVQEPRPHITYPESKLLFSPLMSWKSFPSDHAMVAWLVVGLAVLFGLPGVEILAALALWVSFGRVYAGVHYPFDIVGGFAVAALVTFMAYYCMVVFF